MLGSAALIALLLGGACVGDALSKPNGLALIATAPEKSNAVRVASWVTTESRGVVLRAPGSARKANPMILRRGAALVAALVILPACEMQFHALTASSIAAAISWNDDWTGVFQCPLGVQQPEVVRIVRRGRNLIATKMTGDQCVPAGFIAWEAALPKHLITVNDLPLSFKAAVTAGAPGQPMARVLGSITILSPDRMTIEGAGGIEFTRGTTLAQTSLRMPEPLAPAVDSQPPGLPPLAASADTAPGQSAAHDPHQCDLRTVDWKNFTYPKQSRVGESFTMKNGAGSVQVDTGLDSGPEVDNSYSFTFGKAEYRESAGSTEVFVTMTAAWMGPGNAGTDYVQVFVFKNGHACAPQFLGAFDSSLEGKLVGSAYVVDDGRQRTEWHVANGRVKQGKTTPSHP